MMQVVIFCDGCCGEVITKDTLGQKQQHGLHHFLRRLLHGTQEHFEALSQDPKGIFNNIYNNICNIYNKTFHLT